LDGNRGLARVGEAIMKLVLLDQCYLFCVHESEMPRTFKSTRNMKRD
jgi:hypothetical protein